MSLPVQRIMDHAGGLTAPARQQSVFVPPDHSSHEQLTPRVTFGVVQTTTALVESIVVPTISLRNRP